MAAPCNRVRPRSLRSRPHRATRRVVHCAAVLCCTGSWPRAAACPRLSRFSPLPFMSFHSCGSKRCGGILALLIPLVTSSVFPVNSISLSLPHCAPRTHAASVMWHYSTRVCLARKHTHACCTGEEGGDGEGRTACERSGEGYTSTRAGRRGKGMKKSTRMETTRRRVMHAGRHKEMRGQQLPRVMMTPTFELAAAPCRLRSAHPQQRARTRGT